MPLSQHVAHVSICLCVLVLLSTQTFDGNTQFILQGDFAAVCELKAKNVGTCERPTTANKCLIIVLHSPGPLVLGEERQVKTDYWRVWSNAKGSYAFHQAVVTKIAMHYKKLIPGQQWLKIKSDGCRLFC